jgi:hypothetical protein
MTFSADFMTTDPRSCAGSAAYVVLVFFCDEKCVNAMTSEWVAMVWISRIGKKTGVF